MATPEATDSKRRRLTPDERRERILEGALEVFAKRGYPEASMGEIAEAAGISPAVIYDHFDSKAALQITLLQSQTDDLLAFVGSAFRTAPPGPAQRLRTGVDAFFTFVEEHGFAWRMLFRDPPADPKVAAAYRRLDQQATKAIAVFIKAGAPAGALGDSDPDQTAEMYAQMLKMAQNGLAAWWYEHRSVPREVIVERVLEFCWIGLERVATGERTGTRIPLNLE